MKHCIIAAVGVLVLAIPTGASGSTAPQREYKRGYTDCAAGRWDENQHGASYKEGCRAAEDKRDAANGPSSSSGSSARGSQWGSETDEVPEAALKRMLETCRARAAKAYKVSPDMVDTKYEGTRVDGTHPVNGMVRISPSYSAMG